MSRHASLTSLSPTLRRHTPRYARAVALMAAAALTVGGAGPALPAWGAAQAGLIAASGTNSDSISFDILRSAGNGSTIIYKLTNIALTLTSTSPGIASLSIAVPTGLEIAPGTLTAPSGWDSTTAVESTSTSYNYQAVTGAPLSAAATKDLLSKIDFTTTNAYIAGEITVSFSADSVISWVDDAGYKHFYQTFTVADEDSYGEASWPNAYNRALNKTFNGLKGYLVTISSKAEADVMANFISGSGAWAGATRISIKCASPNTSSPTPNSTMEGFDSFYTGPGMDNSGVTRVGFDC
ncbi:MAG: hypothetical protein LBH48_03445, partial [Bifidobacteriaceae bacterium]|nr:hypothetical protein [Bifidobacteriaceae bacterium]